jgi:hypothetical protein
VDEAAEWIAAFDVYRSTPGEWDRVDRAIGRSLAKAMARPGHVVVADELD